MRYRKAALNLAAVFGAALLAAPVKAMPPSFDCRRASNADEFAICASSELSELDHIMATGFNFLRLRLGTEAVTLGRPLLKLRQSCGYDQECILQKQVAAIQTYQKLGAPIQLPQWVEGRYAENLSSKATLYSTDQSELIAKKIAVSNLRLFSRIDSSSLASFTCENSDYKDMEVCALDAKSGSGGREIYKRTTLTFNKNTGEVFYIFSLQKRRGALNALFANEIRRVTQLVGSPTKHLVATLPGDRYASHIVYWGSIELSQLSADEMQNVISGLPTGKGYLVDYELSLRYSAQNNYPIYSVSGDAGFILNYRMDNDGTERIASRLVAPEAFAEIGVATPTWVPPPTPTTPVTPKPPICELSRRQRLIDSANTFLDDLNLYLKLHSETPDIASLAQEASRLQSAVNGEDCPGMEATTQTLKHRMEKVPGFAEFERAQNEEREKRRVQALGEAVTLASKHQQFLRKQISGNLTSPSTPVLATFLNEYESVLRKPNLSILTDLNNRLKKFVSENGLTQTYDEAMAEAEREPEQKPDVKPEAETSTEPEIPKTPLNRDLLEGDLTDWVLLFNASGKAPHVLRNIRGDIVFEGQQADGCVLHAPTGKVDRANVEDILANYKVETVRLDSAPCPETKLKSYDVLIALRGELLKQPSSYLAPLLGLVEDGTFQKLETLTSEEFQKVKNKWKVEGTEIESEIEAGTRPGYGLVRIDNDSAVICMTTADAEQAAQRALLNEQRKVLLRFFNTAPEVSSTTVDAAFTAAKRDECGAIYASRLDLWATIQGLRRDKIAYSVVPLWFEPKEVADRTDQIVAEKDRLAKAGQELERQREEEQKLAQLHEEAHAKEKATQEAKLQAENGPQARARADEIATAIKALAEEKKTWVRSEFRDLAEWYRDRREEGWEYVALDHQIVDYGKVDWKGRPLEAVFTDVLISMKNKLLGENKTFCLGEGLIFDAEFDMRRDPLEVIPDQSEVTPCEKAPEAWQEWKRGHGFRSQWVAE